MSNAVEVVDRGLLRRSTRALAAIAISAAALAGANLLVSSLPHSALGEIPSFQLRNVSGNPVDNRSLGGRPYVLIFGYTRCPDICPTTLARLVRARRLAGLASRLRIIFVSVDPANDTPITIDTYLQAFDSDLIGLSGSIAATERASRAFGASAIAARGSRDRPIVHSATIFLVDARGRLVEAVAHDAPVADLTTKLREAARSG